MDFDDLDDAEAELGPTPAEEREELLKKQVPDEMPGACKHPRPEGKGFGGGNMRTQKVLYLHGPGSTKSMAQQQVNSVFGTNSWVKDFKIFEWHYFMGSINNKVEEIHADPNVAKLFIPYGNKCGETYDGYLSYVFMYDESHNDETWLGPSAREQLFTKGALPEDSGFDEVMKKLAEHLAEEGPYDGICGFDMGGCLAFEAARLAQEGDPRFAQKFRYLMLFSTRGHRELANFGQGKMRPKAPLQIPTFMGWSESDDSKQYSNYEDAALYIHPEYRGLFFHPQGHRPPAIKNGTKEGDFLEDFVGAMQADVKFKVPENSYKDFWLPLLREPLPVVPPGAPRKLIVIEDPLGEHGPMPAEADKNWLLYPAQESPVVRTMRLNIFRQVTGTATADFEAAKAEVGGAASGVEVVGATYSEQHRKMEWHPEVKDRDNSAAYTENQGRSRWLQVEDEVALPWEKVRVVADELLEAMEMSRDDCVGVVGLGAGAHVAFAFAEAMMKRKSFTPARLFLACPPTVWPWEGAPSLGALANTPVRYLTSPQSVAGPPWRLETATLGEFTHAHFTDKAGMLRLVVEEMASLGV